MANIYVIEDQQWLRKAVPISIIVIIVSVLICVWSVMTIIEQKKARQNDYKGDLENGELNDLALWIK